MRNIIGVLIALVALVGVTSSASASATIDLIWANSGTSTTSVLTSSTGIVLNVVLTAGPNGAQGGAISVDYTLAIGELTIRNFASTPGGSLPFVWQPPSHQLNNEEFIDYGGQWIENINSWSNTGWPPGDLSIGLTAGQSHILGTVTFDSTDSEGAFVLTSKPADIWGGVYDLDGNWPPVNTSYNSATINVVPEPGTLSLLGMGLGGLYVVGRKRPSVK